MSRCLTERSIDHLIPMAEHQGKLWARHGFDATALIREHSRYWPGGRAGKVRIILAPPDGARRAGGSRR